MCQALASFRAHANAWSGPRSITAASSSNLQLGTRTPATSEALAPWSIDASVARRASFCSCSIVFWSHFTRRLSTAGRAHWPTTTVSPASDTITPSALEATSIACPRLIPSTTPSLADPPASARQIRAIQGAHAREVPASSCGNLNVRRLRIGAFVDLRCGAETVDWRGDPAVARREHVGFANLPSRYVGDLDPYWLST